jgi:hypothetical protein
MHAYVSSEPQCLVIRPPAHIGYDPDAIRCPRLGAPAHRPASLA